MDFKDAAPAAVNAHYDSMPNSVRSLYATVQMTALPFIKKEFRVEAWGQLCFDDAAARYTAYHMYNNGMRTGWRFVSWRCEMDGPLIGPNAKLNGLAPPDFDIHNYVPRR